MIEFFYETDFTLDEADAIKKWIVQVIDHKGFEISQINYIFCDDEYLLDLNKKFLNHDYYTDILSFDDSHARLLGGDIYISVTRVTDNAKGLNISFLQELKRVIIHGILHFMGIKDKTNEEQQNMREHENACLEMFA